MIKDYFSAEHSDRYTCRFDRANQPLLVILLPAALTAYFFATCSKASC